jgi:group I intron endonuclease
MNNSCIYKIKNTKTGDEYIGSTLRGFEWRKCKHLRELKQNKHHNRHLQNAYNKYGEYNFQFEIIEKISNPILLIKKEQEWILKSSPVYNVMRDIKSHIGIKRSEETRKKISDALTGKHLSEETKQKLRSLNTGKKQSLKTIQKKREKNFKPVIQLSREGNFIKEWKSATEAAEQLKIKRYIIYACINGRKPTYKSFRWKQK